MQTAASFPREKSLTTTRVKLCGVQYSLFFFSPARSPPRRIVLSPLQSRSPGHRGPTGSAAVRGMIKNNVDFCYKNLSSHHRLLQTIPFRFGNCMGSENKILILILSILLVHGLFILPW